MKLPSCRRSSVGIALAAVACVLAFSCSSGSGSPGDGSGSFPIADQPLQGSILGEAFAFVDGGAAIIGTGENPDYFFELFNEEHSEYFDPWEWDGYAASAHNVSFQIPLAVGTYPLYNRYDGSVPRVATLYDATSKSYLSADEGSIRIDSIDAVNHTVSGAIAARGSVDRDDWVNGGFTVEYEHH